MQRAMFWPTPKNKVEWTKEAEVRKAEFLVVDEAREELYSELLQA